jgi:hypothetical protein
VVVQRAGSSKIVTRNLVITIKVNSSHISLMMQTS